MEGNKNKTIKNDITKTPAYTGENFKSTSNPIIKTKGRMLSNFDENLFMPIKTTKKRMVSNRVLFKTIQIN